MLKTCTKCSTAKEAGEFSANSRTKDGLFSWCKSCSSAHAKARRAKDPERHRENFKKWVSKNKSYHREHKRLWSKANPHKSRQYALKSKFGVTLGWYENTLAQQGGCCAICASKDPGGRDGKSFAIDHNHLTGKARGLLCSRCNTGLGHFSDSADTLAAAASYLVQHAG